MLSFELFQRKALYRYLLLLLDGKCKKQKYYQKQQYIHINLFECIHISFSVVYCYESYICMCNNGRPNVIIRIFIHYVIIGTVSCENSCGTRFNEKGYKGRDGCIAFYAKQKKTLCNCKIGSIDSLLQHNLEVDFTSSFQYMPVTCFDAVSVLLTISFGFFTHCHICRCVL